jgi:hypothetical protein
MTPIRAVGFWAETDPVKMSREVNMINNDLDMIFMDKLRSKKVPRFQGSKVSRVKNKGAKVSRFRGFK